MPDTPNVERILAKLSAIGDARVATPRVISDAHDAGIPILEISRRTGISLPTIYRILGGLDPKKRPAKWSAPDGSDNTSYQP